MFDKILKSISNYVLHLMIKNSDMRDLSLDIKESNGTFVLGINSRVVVGTGSQTVRNEKKSKTLLKVFVIALLLMLAFTIVGMIIPDASLGRSFLAIGEFPAFLVNVIAARYIIKNIS